MSSTTVHRTPSSKTPQRQSLFFRDLASPISSHRPSSRFATPGQAAAVSALWRENLSTSDTPPPPPVFTLEDRVDFSPEPAPLERSTSPGSVPDPKTPTPTKNYFSTPSPVRTRVGEGSGNGGVAMERSPGSGSWWAPQQWSDEKGKGSPVDGIVNSKALVMLPPPREVARPEMKRSQLVPASAERMDEEEWVTVYGFSPGDTNLVLREFEKCGVILKHIPGPGVANWMHILYQNRYDAQKALGKNGIQLNSVLIVGVKLVEPVQRRYLNERINGNSHGNFMVSLPPQSSGRSAAFSTLTASPCPQNLQNDGSSTINSGRQATGAIASPAKSVVSKVMDLMFGF